MTAPAIRTFEDAHRGADLHAVAGRYPSSVGDRTMPAPGVCLDRKVKARVNHGRWVADCPDPYCQGCEYVSFDRPVFFCCECRNAGVGSQPIPVEVPGPMKRRHVETYLRARPDHRTRNWYPHESVAHLRDENRAHGILLLPEDRQRDAAPDDAGDPPPDDGSDV